MNSHNDTDEQALKALRRQVLMLQILVALLVAFAIWSLVKPNTNDGPFEELVTEKLVVTDRDGNASVVIASEIGRIHSRLRIDTLRGILILDENGVDRVALGATPTIQAHGKITSRIGNTAPYGFAFNDADGDERGGMGFYADRGLVSFGMDNKTGEGLTMFVADSNLYQQKVGLLMQVAGKGQVMYLGANTAGESMVNLDAPGKGRFAMTIDSSGRPGLSLSNYATGSQRDFLVE